MILNSIHYRLLGPILVMTIYNLVKNSLFASWIVLKSMNSLYNFSNQFPQNSAADSRTPKSMTEKAFSCSKKWIRAAYFYTPFAQFIFFSTYWGYALWNACLPSNIFKYCFLLTISSFKNFFNCCLSEKPRYIFFKGKKGFLFPLRTGNTKAWRQHKTFINFLCQIISHWCHLMSHCIRSDWKR